MNATPHNELFVGALHRCVLSGDPVAAPVAVLCSSGEIYPDAFRCVVMPLFMNHAHRLYFRHSEERSDEESLCPLHPAGALPQ